MNAFDIVLIFILSYIMFISRSRYVIYLYTTTTNPINNSSQARIDKLEYRDGNTNTSGGLYMMNSVIFKPQNGDRSKVSQ